MKIDGKKIAEKIFEELKIKVKKLQEKNIIPKLAIILVGDDPASLAYVNRKQIQAKEIAIEADVHKFPKNISQDKLLKIIKQYNNDKKTHGIIIQQPLPKQINTSLIVNALSPDKDVDGFLENSKFEVPIANAVLEILEEVFGHLRGGDFKKWLKNKKIVVMGKGNTGGKPTINMLKKMGIDIQVIDSKTKNTKNLMKRADIIISAVGKQNMITKDMVKKRIILISVGLSKGTDGKMHGDYEEQGIKNIASFYTPTPGGVGPVNIAMLLKNLITATEKSVSH